MKLKKALTIALFYVIGLVCVLALCLRAEQVNNDPIYNEPSYYELSNK